MSADDRAVWESVAKSIRTTRPAAVVPVAEPTKQPNEERPSPPERPVETQAFLRPPGGVLRKGAGHGGQGSGSAPSGAARPAWAGVLREGDAPPRPVGRPEAGLDRRTAERLRRGEREPDARIDLHGMTAERAHRALDRFIGAAASSGARVVLVITGKGGRHAPQDAPWLPPGRGVLRDAAPRWLRQGTHGHRILGIYEAHLRHGGAGAFYVYLKKPR
ncbi:MAG: Smr/MutS family protein [Pseudomonadota bacterium]